MGAPPFCPPGATHIRGALHRYAPTGDSGWGPEAQAALLERAQASSYRADSTAAPGRGPAMESAMLCGYAMDSVSQQVAPVKQAEHTNCGSLSVDIVRRKEGAAWKGLLPACRRSLAPSTRRVYNAPGVVLTGKNRRKGPRQEIRLDLDGSGFLPVSQGIEWILSPCR